MSNESALKNIIAEIKNMECQQLRLSFIRKSRSGYTAFAPNVSAGVKDDVWGLIEAYLEEIKDLSVVNYSPTSHKDETVEHCFTRDVKNYSAVIERIRLADFTETEINPDDISFYCLQIMGDVEENNVYFFRRVTKFKRLSNDGFVGIFRGKQFDKLESKILGVDRLIDILCYHDDIFIFNHIGLERIFDMKDQFSEMAKGALKKIRSLNKIANIDSFEEDCLDDKRVQRSLAKISPDFDEISGAIYNIDAIKRTIDIFDLDIEVNEKGQLIYREKKQIMDILRFIGDAYCETILGKRNVTTDV